VETTLLAVEVQTLTKFGTTIVTEHGTAIGRAIKLHDVWPDEFYEVAETTPTLKPFQWMVDVLREKHNKVAEELLVQILTPDSLTLTNAGVVVGAAYASNELVILDDAANRERAKVRAKVLDKKQDLLLAQHRLIPPPKMFLTTQAALNKAMIPICGSNAEKDKHVKYYAAALEICGTFEAENDTTQGALMVWMRALLADKDQWLHWIDQEPDLTAVHIQEEIRESTIFGQLVDYGDELLNENSAVAWTNSWDKLELLDDLFSHVQLRRLITAFCRSRIGNDVEMIVA
jgi:hypothetical protein